MLALAGAREQLVDESAALDPIEFVQTREAEHVVGDV
jgi:hypothetical protein